MVQRKGQLGKVCNSSQESHNEPHVHMRNPTLSSSAHCHLLLLLFKENLLISQIYKDNELSSSQGDPLQSTQRTSAVRSRTQLSRGLLSEPVLHQGSRLCCQSGGENSLRDREVLEVWGDEE